MGSASVERVWGFLPFYGKKKTREKQTNAVLALIQPCYNNNMHNQTKRRENPDLPKNEDAVTPVGAAVA
jgi:hypothetical protein